MDEPRSDSELLSAFAEHQDEAALAALIQRHGRLVLGVCRKVLDHSQDAEDAAQATFITLSKKAPTLTGMRSLAAWLHHVAYCVAVNALKQRTVRNKQEQITDMRTVTVAKPEESVAESTPLLLAELDGLPRKYREALVLFHLNGNSLEQTATALNCPAKTVSSRLVRGRDMLRNRLVRRGVAIPAVALAALLSKNALAAEVPNAFVMATVKEASAFISGQALPPQIAALTKGALKMLFWTKIKTTAAAIAVLVLILGGVSMLHLSAGEPTPGVAANGAQTPVAAPNPVVITPKASSAMGAFEALRRQGLTVVVLPDTPRTTSGDWPPQIRPGFADLLQVPADLRSKEVDGVKLLEAIATAHQLKVAWAHGKRTAVLYVGAPAAEIETVRQDLGSPTASVRCAAAWRAGWLPDVQTIPLLVKAASDEDAEVKRQSRASLRRLGWKPVLALDEQAWDAMSEELTAPRAEVRSRAVAAVEWLGGPKGNAAAAFKQALALRDHEGDVRTQDATVAKLLTDPGYRADPGPASAYIAGEKGIALVEKDFSEQDAQKRRRAVQGLGFVLESDCGGDKALTLLEKALADPEYGVRWEASRALAYAGGEKGLALVERVLRESPDLPHLRVVAAAGVNGESSAIRHFAAIALANLGGEHALTLLEKALTDPAVEVRGVAAGGLGDFGEKAVPALVTALRKEQDLSVRTRIVGALRSPELANLPKVKEALGQEPNSSPSSKDF